MEGCKLRSLICIAAGFSVIFSCARQAAPTGGPKDVTPPKIIRSVPENHSLNFKGKKIIITFDEFVTLDKITEKFMISPPVMKKPNIVLKGKSIDIEFLEKLKDSTTYTMYFEDAIRDLNEGNIIPDFQFMFSTGNVLDSLSVTGNVLNSSNLEVPEKTLILMHRHLADSAPLKLLPDYIALADINGGFRINNTRAGTYRLFGLQDKNNNKKYDLADEGFAFLDTTIDINKVKNYLPVITVKDTSKIKSAKEKKPEIPLVEGEYKLLVFTSPQKNHYLSSSGRKTAYHLIYTLSLPPDTIKFQFNIQNVSEKGYFIEESTAKDTINVWLTDSLAYSKQIITTYVGYPFTDTTGITRLKTDTIPMRFTPPRATRGKEVRNKYSYTTSISGSSIAPGQQIVFLSETPFRRPDTSKIHLFKSEKEKQIPVPYTLIRDSLSSRRYVLSAKLKEGDTFQLITDSSSFGNIYGGVSDSAGIKFNVKTQDTYGRLILNLSNVRGNIIIQVLDQKEKLIQEKKARNDNKIQFTLLEVGKYRLRAINDLNNDGKWTTGDYKSKRQPEPVKYFPEEIVIKANWDSDENWSLDKWSQKAQKLREKKDQGK
jgi:uncharacterized protein (DUF2141 family)